MEMANVVFEHPFDKSTLEQLVSLRSLRLSMAETMLRDLSKTSAALMDRGLVDNFSQDEHRQELMTRISNLRLRLNEPNVVYADELDLYVDLLTTDDLDD